MTRTTRYLGTFHYDSAGEMLALDELRASVRKMNKALKKDDARDRHGRAVRFYVKCQGRGPRAVNGQPAHRYAQSLPLKYATHVDAYIYRRDVEHEAKTAKLRNFRKMVAKSDPLPVSVTGEFPIA